MYHLSRQLWHNITLPWHFLPRLHSTNTLIMCCFWLRGSVRKYELSPVRDSGLMWHHRVSCVFVWASLIKILRSSYRIIPHYPLLVSAHVTNILTTLTCRPSHRGSSYSPVQYWPQSPDSAPASVWFSAGMLTTNHQAGKIHPALLSPIICLLFN